MCSLRSCPVQKARPVPVSTTHRTAVSSATCCTISRSSTLVATSRLFIASGRFRVIVATPFEMSRRTGASVMAAVCRTGSTGLWRGPPLA